MGGIESFPGLLRKVKLWNKYGTETRNLPMSKKSIKEELYSRGWKANKHPRNSNKSEAYRFISTGPFPNRSERRFLQTN